MKKSDIKSRIQEIDNRLSELPTICEREKRELTETETREMEQLTAERSDLKRQLDDIERGETREVHQDKGQKFSLLSAIRSIVNGGKFEGAYADEVRALVCQVAAVMLLPLVWELDGIWASIVAAELGALVLTVICFVKFRKRYYYA